MLIPPRLYLDIYIIIALSAFNAFRAHHLISIEQAGNLEESATNSRETVKNLEESILKYSNDLSRMKKSRNFWQALTIAALVLGTGGIAAAAVF
jgi:hypothetical protein